MINFRSAELKAKLDALIDANPKIKKSEVLAAAVSEWFDRLQKSGGKGLPLHVVIPPKLGLSSEETAESNAAIAREIARRSKNSSKT